jgi:hypothetical protein
MGLDNMLSGPWPVIVFNENQGIRGGCISAGKSWHLPAVPHMQRVEAFVQTMFQAEAVHA